MQAGRFVRSGGASSGCRKRKGRMMDKIDRTDYRMYLMTAPLIVDMLDKFDELVEGYNELSARIDSIWAHRDRMRRIKNRKNDEQ